MTTMEDLYPDGHGYHDAHGPYIDAVAKALDEAGFKTDISWSDPNDPRDGWIGFDMEQQPHRNGEPVWSYDEVGIGWSENRGWHLLCIDDRNGRDSRYVFELAIARLASPETVANAVAEQAGIDAHVASDDYPDVDFPEHTFEDDDIPFDQALAQYREPA
ncbi:hypothetical protein ACWT_5872 [Actinoplanes sp. SE50]|uniref:DUF6292 family protein n=1 Tax=unclassified Actinoplanes TaxID=2626549 RepID=UPI00023EBDDC|nr:MULTISPECIES: DUF6292 family protein [unclassified Actinoplanes]AEV86890.1 hypothetical protein ACPL_6003 [Actinoplanes sp. SE50/110]ATO85287.1 hypothetical protein ACWT_5872 [Actinoplanes sp. SE50]SLM02697.1 hypothetical protein ACSP50_5979 [Actinoplanes sp. SE50/110]